ncbi:MAG: D-alanyl-D-alanine carboxypeptidase [Lachnospiraceae bacterium]|nr:D-alanyl-D-alanine carboxypeptidase [Lachnospiraceae bacterium]
MGLRADAAEGAPGELYATAAVLMDADSGRVLYGKNEEAVMAMASTTKIMTCILVLENASPDDTLTVSAYAASMPKVKLYIQKGEQYTVRDLLHSLMLESHNDTAVALAEYIGKQHLPEQLREKDTAEYTAEESKAAVAAFAALMNRKAAELGCEDTWFITPNGLDATETLRLADGSTVQKEHCTTARELARILAYCIRQSPKRQEFLDITRAPSYGFSANGRSFSCTNHNAFLTMMDGALTGKTGFTNKAGYCYVGALERDGRTFVVALLACGWPNNKGYKWTDTRKLMQYGIDNYFYRSFSDQGVAFDESRLKPIPVQNGRTDLLNAIAYTDVVISGRTGGQNGGPGQGEAAAEEGGGGLDGLLLRPNEKIQVRYSMKDSLTAPVEAGSVVGKVEYMVDGILYKQESIVTEDTVEAIDLRWCAEQIWRRFLCTG